MIKSIVPTKDYTGIQEWRDGLNRRISLPPKIQPFIIYRIDQSLFYSTKLTLARRELESRNARVDAGIEPILTLKGFHCTLSRPTPHGVVLISALSTIMSLHTLSHVLTARAKTKFDSSNSADERRLKQLWDLLLPSEPLISRYSDQWSRIGFQGKDPATDFRGMGLLGLDDLLYLAKNYPKLAHEILSSSHHSTSGYSMAIVGINLTSMALNLMRNRELNFHFYQYGVSKEMYHEFYCFLFASFNALWTTSPGLTVMDFSRISQDLGLKMSLHLKLGKESVLPMSPFGSALDKKNV